MRLRSATVLWACILACLTSTSQHVFVARAQTKSFSNNTGSSSQSGGENAFVGDVACGQCHEDKIASYEQTAHFLTSRLPDRSTVLGSFSAGANELKTSNPLLFFRMDRRDNASFETAVFGGTSGSTSHTEKIDLVIGSGRKGQTFAYWRGSQLFQLPVSYWTQMGWVNSPGYRDGEARFDRPIIPRCVECHATYFEALPPPPNTYSQSGFILGITCEKCHGPGKAHVAHMQGKSRAGIERTIINPARFSRERQMDLCGWCHGGHGSEIQPWFSYIPGEPLEKYIELPQPKSGTEIDVHGSQLELLGKSRCYESSQMTCLTCHNVHKDQHDLKAFSQTCLGCHKLQACGQFAARGSAIADNCIDCHMPKQETNLIVFDTNGKSAKPQVRNHRIAIYKP